jgi:hypothetical protein
MCWETRNVYNVLVSKSHEKRPERQKRNWNANVILELEENKLCRFRGSITGFSEEDDLQVRPALLLCVSLWPWCSCTADISPRWFNLKVSDYGAQKS